MPRTLDLDAGRKVNVEAELIVMVPVRVKADILVRADVDANVEYAIKQYFKGKKGRKYTKADVEAILLEEIVDINGLEGEDDLMGGIQEELDACCNPIMVSRLTVTDSR